MIQVFTNLPIDSDDWDNHNAQPYAILLSVASVYNIVLVFDENMETYINSNNVYFRSDDKQSIVKVLNSLYRTLLSFDLVVKD